MNAGQGLSPLGPVKLDERLLSRGLGSGLAETVDVVLASVTVETAISKVVVTRGADSLRLAGFMRISCSSRDKMTQDPFSKYGALRSSSNVSVGRGDSGEEGEGEGGEEEEATVVQTRQKRTKRSAGHCLHGFR